MYRVLRPSLHPGNTINPASVIWIIASGGHCSIASYVCMGLMRPRLLTTLLLIHRVVRPFRKLCSICNSLTSSGWCMILCSQLWVELNFTPQVLHQSGPNVTLSIIHIIDCTQRVNELVIGFEIRPDKVKRLARTTRNASCELNEFPESVMVLSVNRRRGVELGGGETKWQ